MAGLTSQVKIENEKAGLLVVVMTVPEAVGDFEKIVYLKNVVGHELTLRLRGTSKPRVLLSQGNLVVSEYVNQTDGIYLEAASACDEDLNAMEWTAESSIPIQVVCRPKDGIPESVRLDFICQIDSKIKDSSIMVYLTGKSREGLVLAKKDFQLLLGYNASTSPRRLVLKKSNGVYKGVLVVRRANYLGEGVNEAKTVVELGFGEELEARIELVAMVQRLRNGSFLLKFDLESDSELEGRLQESIQADCQLFLDLKSRDFNVPVVFQ